MRLLDALSHIQKILVHLCNHTYFIYGYISHYDTGWCMYYKLIIYAQERFDFNLHGFIGKFSFSSLRKFTIYLVILIDI